MTTALRERLDSAAAIRDAHKAMRWSRLAVPLGLVRVASLVGKKTNRSFPVTAKTFWGDRMAVRLPEDLSAHLYTYRYFEHNLSAFLLDRLRPGDTFFDVGAHYGYFSMLAAHITGADGHVHAFEPTPSSCDVLRANVNALPGVRVNEAAAWHETGEISFHDFGDDLSMYNSIRDPRLPTGHEARTGSTISVKAITLDDYVRSTAVVPTFVKIDAESTELQVLEGMADTISEHHPVLTLEVGDAGIDGAPLSRELIEYAVGLGYEAMEFRNGQIRPHALQDRYTYDNIMLV